MSALKVLLNCRNLGLLAIDMTDLPRDLKDRLANWGVCGKGLFYGYKIHLIVTRDGVPLAVVVTKANQTKLNGADGDRAPAQPVAATADGGAVGAALFCYAVADAAYDTIR